MVRVPFVAVLAGSLLALATVVPVAARIAYSDRPPVAHTGGLGEPSCHACHFDERLNDPRGSLSLGGVPERYDPGESYRIIVTLSRRGMGAGGFQLAARYTDGSAAGRQAGSFRVTDDRAAVSEGKTGVLYPHHVEAGTSLTGRDTATWTLEWTAPAEPSLPVTFHAAANAANGDDSEFGDFIYLHSKTTRPAASASSPKR